MTLPSLEFERTGSCDSCKGRWNTAFCCTSIDAGSIFANITQEAREALGRSTSRKILSFGTPLKWDFVRFCRLHGLDGEMEIHIGEGNPEEHAIPVRVMLRTHNIEIWSTSNTRFRLGVPQDDDVKFVIQIPCKEYNAEGRTCNIYENRPKVCKVFPIVPEQVMNTPCAFKFVPKENVRIKTPDGETMELRPIGS